jgi:hypothetical protein
MSMTGARIFATIHLITRTARKSRIFEMERKTVSSRFWRLLLISNEARGWLAASPWQFVALLNYRYRRRSPYSKPCIAYTDAARSVLRESGKLSSYGTGAHGSSLFP